ncbi:MAG: hypothetical protein JWO37_3337 [Acidimicrobiales bacterium]|jgi:hypothetical protein|nr:hypothetical protein [Acidimicrobiales bacterium]
MFGLIASSLPPMGRKKNAEAEGSPKKKKHRLRKLLLLSAVGGAIAAFRNKRLADNAGR